MGFLDGGAKDAARASENAAQMSADYQNRALDYLQQRDAVPSGVKDAALSQLAGIYGIGSFGGQSSQQPVGLNPAYQDQYRGMTRGGAMGTPVMNQGQVPQPQEYQQNPMSSVIQRAKASPIYQSMLQDGEEAILRSASATGGLRGGGSIADVNKFSQNALNMAYQDQMSGLKGLAGLQTNENSIANTMMGVGDTLSQGIVASGQAAQQGKANTMNNLMGLGGLGMLAFSDARLKDDHVLIGRHKGFNVYKWKWNKKANEIGLTGEGVGFMAHEVNEKRPDLVIESDGYLAINLGGLV